MPFHHVLVVAGPGWRGVAGCGGVWRVEVAGWADGVQLMVNMAAGVLPELMAHAHRFPRPGRMTHDLHLD